MPRERAPAKEHDDALILAWLRAMVASRQVAEIRTRCGPLTQAEIARAVGATPAAVSGWESGRRMPSGPMALRYARLLDGLERQYKARAAAGCLTP